MCSHRLKETTDLVSAPEVPCGWSVSPLSELADPNRPITYGIVQPGQHTDGGVPIARVNDIKDGRINPDEPLRVAHSIASKYERTCLRGGELLLTLVGTVGETAVVPPELIGWNVARAVAVISVRPEIGAEWVRICLRTKELQHLIRTWCTTTVQATFNLRDVARLPIPIPPCGVRQAIISILGSLDDKIELNRRMNRTLEEMAAAIFKAWFVDFEPVKAKAAGAKSFPSMPQAVFDALPTTFVDSPLGPIPKGWTLGTIDDSTSLIIDHRGKTPKKLGGDWAQSGIPAVSAKNVKAGHLVERQAMNYVDEAMYRAWMREELQVGDILLTSEAPLGEMYYLARAARYCLSQRVFALRADPRRCRPIYLYRWLISGASQERMQARATGTTVVGIRQSELRKVEVVLPLLSVQSAAADQLDAWMARFALNSEEAGTLAAIRDALLPKLLSGEIRIKNAECLAGGAR